MHSESKQYYDCVIDVRKTSKLVILCYSKFVIQILRNAQNAIIDFKEKKIWFDDLIFPLSHYNKKALTQDKTMRPRIFSLLKRHWLIFNTRPYKNISPRECVSHSTIKLQGKTNFNNRKVENLICSESLLLSNEYRNTMRNCFFL